MCERETERETPSLARHTAHQVCSPTRDPTQQHHTREFSVRRSNVNIHDANLGKGTKLGIETPRRGSRGDVDLLFYFVGNYGATL